MALAKRNACARDHRNEQQSPCPVLARKDQGAGTFAARSFGGCVGIKKRNLDFAEAQLPCAGGIQTTTGGSKNMCDSNYPGLHDLA
jgi:hypothetical protein